MAGRRLTLLVLLTSGIPFGLLMGITDAAWAGDHVLDAVLFGAGMAFCAWFSPLRPTGVSEDLWDALSRAEKRAVVRAIRENAPLPESLHAWTAAQLRREIEDDDRATWLDHLFSLLVFGGLTALVVIAANRGAPEGWIVAGCVCVVVWLAVGIYIRLPQGRRSPAA